MYNDSSYASYTATSALNNAFLRVKLDGSTTANVVVAGAGEDFVGVAQNAVSAGVIVNVKLRRSTGTQRFVASGAITAGALIYGDASGKVTATAKGSPIGRAVTAAAADGDVIQAVVTGANPEIVTGQKTANSTDATNGYIEVDPGFGAAPANGFIAQVRSSAGAVRTVTTVAHQGSGVMRLTVTSLANNDVASWVAGR
jgi:hypothetical protein